MLDIRTFTNDGTRASFLADHVADPEDALRTVLDATDFYVESNGLDALPEDLCGPVSGLISALMVGSLMAGFDGPDGEWSGEPLALMMKMAITSQTVEHAAYDHYDSLALAIRGTSTLSEGYDAIVEWVGSTLWTLADLSVGADLSDFDLWEDENGPDLF